MRRTVIRLRVQLIISQRPEKVKARFEVGLGGAEWRLRCRLTHGRARHFGDCGGRKIDGVPRVDGANLFRVRKRCDSASHTPALHESYRPSISTKRPCPRLFNFLHQPPRIYSGRCLMHDRKLSSPLATGDQYPASIIRDLPPADWSCP
jgi:hypothetical protein